MLRALAMEWVVSSGPVSKGGLMKRLVARHIAKGPARQALEKGVTRLANDLGRAIGTSGAVLDAEIDRSKRIGSTVREQLERIRKHS